MSIGTTTPFTEALEGLGSILKDVGEDDRAETCEIIAAHLKQMYQIIDEKTEIIEKKDELISIKNKTIEIQDGVIESYEETLKGGAQSMGIRN